MTRSSVLTHCVGSAIAIAQPAQATQVVFIDRQLPDYQELAAGVLPNIAVFFLDPDRDGVRQIAQILATQAGVTAVHLVSHGSPGSIRLGNANLSLETLSGYEAELRQWSEALASQAEVVIYGCEVGKGEKGTAIAYCLSEQLGASVTASATKTGNADLGGDWQLTVRTGQRSVSLAFSTALMAAYQGVMPSFPDEPHRLFR
jgi:hypothetical protein